MSVSGGKNRVMTMIRKKVYCSERVLPTVDQLERELRQEDYRVQFARVLRSTVYALITVAAVSVLIAMLWMPVLHIYGASMSPALAEGDIVIALKGSSFRTGDVIAFYYNNKILVKRVIAQAGDWVDIDEKGNVYVNNRKLEESYVSEKSLGDCDIELPYQVPESRIFVMGDHRSVSVDSRNALLGCVSEEQIVGKVVFRIWPVNKMGIV